MKKLIIIGILMATFSMFGTTTTITTTGDEEGCKAYLGEAHRLLYQLREAVAFQKIPIYAIPRNFEDSGVSMRATTVNGRERVYIHKPLKPTKVSEVDFESIPIVYAGQFLYGTQAAGWAQAVTPVGKQTWNRTIESVPQFYSWLWKVDRSADGDLFAVGREYFYNPDTGLAYDQYDWVVKRLGRNGKATWTQKYANGYAVDVAADDTGVYIVGAEYTGEIKLATRIEKRSRRDGSLIWAKTIQKEGVSIDFECARSCDLDSENLYVSERIDWDLSNPPQKSQGRVLTIDKGNGEVKSTFIGNTAISPFASYRSYSDIDIAVKDRKGMGAKNVYVMSELWVQPLDGSWKNTLDYGYVINDFQTVDVGIAADDSGVYTIGQLIQASNAFHGYEVSKYTHAGEKVWSKVYDDQAGYLYGPFLADLAVDDKNVYVAGHLKLASETKALQQALDKKTGEIRWTNLAPSVSTGSKSTFWWGVAAPFTEGDK